MEVAIIREATVALYSYIVNYFYLGHRQNNKCCHVIMHLDTWCLRVHAWETHFWEVIIPNDSSDSLWLRHFRSHQYLGCCI